MNASYVVGRPRATDAVGAALRSAYLDRALPEDMQALLRKLNGHHGAPN